MEQSLNRLIDLAQAVGGSAWPILVKNEYVSGLVAIPFLIVMLVVSIIGVTLGIRYFSRGIAMDNTSLGDGTGYVIAGILLLVVCSVTKAFEKAPGFSRGDESKIVLDNV